MKQRAWQKKNGDQKSYQNLSEKILKEIFKALHSMPSLKKASPAYFPGSVEVKLVSSPVMKKLNQHYRKKNFATDVLSFPAPLPFLNQGCLGELIICQPVLRAQARALGHSVEWELMILLVHGFLHLLGFDHEKSEKAAQEMAAWEKKLLKKLSTRNKKIYPEGLIERSKSVKRVL